MTNSAAAIATLASVKNLALIMYLMWPQQGLKFAAGTPYEFHAKMIFEASEAGVIVIMAIASVANGIKTWFKY